MQTPTVELVPGKLHLLGGTIEVDARISWRGAPDAGLFDPINVYLLQEVDGHLLLETGVVALFPDLATQLRAAGFDGTRPLLVAVTRNEPDCLSNVRNLAATFGLERVYAPGIINSLDYFEDLTARSMMISYGVPHTALRPAEQVHIGGDRHVVAVPTPLKMLSTTWYHEAGTATLFCSDIFTDSLGPSPLHRVVDAPEADIATLVAAMRRHLAYRYDWLARSDNRSIVKGLEQLFGRLDIAILAPSRGRVIHGRHAVDQRVEALLQALTELSVH